MKHTKLLSWLATRTGVLLIVAVVGGVWAVLGLPGSTPIAVGATLIGAGTLIVKLVHANAAAVSLRKDLHSQALQLKSQSMALRERSNTVETLTHRLAEHEREIRQVKEAAKRQEVIAGRNTSALADLVAKQKEALADLVAKQKEDALDRRVLHQKVDDTQEFSREGLRVVHTEVDSLVSRISSVPTPPNVDVRDVPEPLLSIAIPAFNRAEHLDQCLQSIADQVVDGAFSQVEVWVTDDCSTEVDAIAVAHKFARKYPFVGFRSNPANLGLEANLMACTTPCSGEYLWIVGNDDRLEPGGLSVVLADLEAREFSVVLYAKTRISRDGQRSIPNSTGTFPERVSAGTPAAFESVLAVAAETGLVSGFGFISTLIVRRAPFVSVDTEPYLGLTMYPQLGVLLEAYGANPVWVRNTTVVTQRTRTASEKLAEAVGRREEGFMAGGAEREARWFGTSYAAMLQRVIDRSDLTATDFRDLPERQFRAPSMVAWMKMNRTAQGEIGIAMAPDVTDDADRFFQATEPI